MQLLPLILLPVLALAIVPDSDVSASCSTCSETMGLDNEQPELQVKRRRIVKRQAGRARLGGCGNERLRQIMQSTLGPLLTVLSPIQMRIGDIAQRLQQVAQRTTGRSFEIMMGKGDLVIASHQMSETSHCRLRLGDFYTMVYETPIQYDINNVEQEKILSNIDFGEKLGGSGFPGQKAFARFDQIITALGGMNATNVGGLANRLGGGFNPIGGGGVFG
ncbi:hypothetical protein PENTCL1PPCAC_16491 [Pristionchus entomophagus]|uniref:Uncharacterized protein n=1 Tax=Pristionchus entomophagus TaxID=358040 RepID=A0AAV5TJ54_9BILA|nr:hypothetical protein PENTCL1PPCAC_16491 [Pristionchus entomophagus]